MEEIEIQIDVIKSEMQELENSVDDFSRYGRSPNENDYLEMIRILSTWSDKRKLLTALDEVLVSIKSNGNVQFFAQQTGQSNY